jgi:hypothetical protein
MLEQRAAEFSRADLVINTGGVGPDRSVAELQELINSHAIM